MIYLSGMVIRSGLKSTAVAQSITRLPVQLFRLRPGYAVPAHYSLRSTMGGCFFLLNASATRTTQPIYCLRVPTILSHTLPPPTTAASFLRQIHYSALAALANVSNASRMLSSIPSTTSNALLRSSLCAESAAMAMSSSATFNPKLGDVAAL